MGHTKTEIFDLIKPTCQSENIFLLEVIVQGSGKNPLVKVIVDTEEGVKLNQCQQLSKHIADIFYRRDLFQGNYRLEVTSPGLEKPLQQPYEYERNIGKQLKVNYHKGEERLQAIGELLAYSPTEISLKLDKDTLTIPLQDIERAKIKLKW